MSATQWLRSSECPLLQGEGSPDPVALRLVQRLLEIPLTHQGSEALAKSALEEIASAIRAEKAAVVEATPEWTRGGYTSGALVAAKRRGRRRSWERSWTRKQESRPSLTLLARTR